jgi:hypothetical protein
MFSTRTQACDGKPPGETNENDEANISLWLQILNAEAPRLLGEDEE